MIKALAALNGRHYFDQEFAITVSYEARRGSKITIDKLFGVLLTDEKISNAQGDEPTKVTYELDVMFVERNGIKVPAQSLVT